MSYSTNPQSEPPYAFVSLDRCPLSYDMPEDDVFSRAFEQANITQSQTRERDTFSSFDKCSFEESHQDTFFDGFLPKPILESTETSPSSDVSFAAKGSSNTLKFFPSCTNTSFARNDTYGPYHDEQFDTSEDIMTARGLQSLIDFDATIIQNFKRRHASRRHASRLGLGIDTYIQLRPYNTVAKFEGWRVLGPATGANAQLWQPSNRPDFPHPPRGYIAAENFERQQNWGPAIGDLQSESTTNQGERILRIRPP
ncbi:hypothetical protein BKA61DRAFT_584642 [Leptodontidium sp. MPI-SDFR-AT-0119]|nr:hypothetical protein BKA61DRAFT_584642 [Leptodontidium sp. MPI-SDFR-AT-0119]